MRQKTKLFAVKFRRILEVLCLQDFQKFLAHYHDLCVQKWSCLLWSSDAFSKFSPCEVYKKSSGRIITIYASKNEAVCREVQTHVGSFHRASFIKRIWAHFLDFASKNEPVCSWVQTHFGSFRLMRFMEKFLGAFSRFMRPKTKLFAVKFRHILEVFILQFFQKFLAHYHDLCVQKWSCLLLSSDAFSKFSLCEVCEGSFGRICTIYTSKSEAVFCEVQTDFGTSLPARFTEKGHVAFSRFMRTKTGLFDVQFRRTLEVFTLRGLWRKFWAHFHDLCIQIWSMVNGLLFHMTQPTSKRIIKAIACSKPTISEH